MATKDKTPDNEMTTESSEGGVSKQATNQSNRFSRIGGPTGIAAVLGVAAGFLIVGTAAGLLVGRGMNTPSGSRTPGAMQQGSDNRMGQSGMQAGPRGGMFGGSTGTVTSVSATSITFTDARSGGSTTFQVTSSTDITDDGDDAAIGDIKVGDTVMVSGTSDEDDTAAATITLNPTSTIPDRQM